MTIGGKKRKKMRHASLLLTSLPASNLGEQCRDTGVVYQAPKQSVISTPSVNNTSGPLT